MARAYPQLLVRTTLSILCTALLLAMAGPAAAYVPAELDRGFGSLNDYVGDIVASLDARLTAAEGRLDGAVAFHGLVRYDAYNEMSGRQSTSIALLDSRGSGIVISSIHHRDQARLYAKQVVEGRALLELSPEEEEAMRAALSGEVPAVGERQRRRSSS